MTNPRTEPYSRRHLPADVGSAYSILDGMTGGRSATMAMLSGTRWPGAELAGPELSRAPARPLRIAQGGAAAAVDVVSEVLPSIGEFTVERLASGALRIGGGAIFTAAALLQELSYISTRTQILDVMSRFGLDQNQAADVLAARAYVTTRTYLWGVYPNLPNNGPVLDRTAEAIMRYERQRPFTMTLAGRGNSAAVAAISQLVAESAAREPDFTSSVYQRTSAVDPALSTSSATARAILGLVTGQQWQAHHLIPFAVMAGLPVPFQQAIVAAGWRMDSLENLIALPANFPTFNASGRVLPMHNTSHINYDADVAAALGPVVAGGPVAFIPTPTQPMNPQVLQRYAANLPVLRVQLKTVEDLQRTRLLAKWYHPQVR